MRLSWRMSNERKRKTDHVTERNKMSNPKAYVCIAGHKRALVEEHFISLSVGIWDVMQIHRGFLRNGTRHRKGHFLERRK